MQKKEKDERSLASKQSADRILQIMSQLRDPQNGCQWDLEQNFESLSKYVIEEAYEVAEAVADGNVDEIMEELGDLLLQVVFFSQIASEKNQFRFLATRSEGHRVWVILPVAQMTSELHIGNRIGARFSVFLFLSNLTRALRKAAA